MIRLLFIVLCLSLVIFPLQNSFQQILPFEQQLEAIRDPKECTRKVIQGRSAELPFTLKVVYDTSRDIKLEFKQQGTSFPVVQRTNQVMTFFTDGADQYEIYVEVNYDQALPRQMYIEYLSNNNIVQSEQEKFNTKRFCMTIFANTVLPIPIPTKEEIFGESLDYIAQIPAMVIAFNANSQTSATNISYQWILLLAVFILSVITIISSHAGKRKFDSKIGDLDDTIVEVNDMTLRMDELETSVTKPLKEIGDVLKAIQNIPLIKDRIPKKESPFKKIISFRKKKDEGVLKTKVVSSKVIDKPKSESEEVLEALQPTEEEIKEEKQQAEEKQSGGFIINELVDEEPTKEKVSPQTPLPKENNPMNLQPKVFNKIMKEIDFKTNKFKEGALDKFSYTELNESFAWISEYRRWIEDEKRFVPEKIKDKQAISENLIYRAIYQKIKERSKI